MAKLTKAQLAVLEHVGANTGRLYGSRGDFCGHRSDVVHRCAYSLGLIEVPRLTPTRTWELTEAGRAALQSKDTQDD